MKTNFSNIVFSSTSVIVSAVALTISAIMLTASVFFLPSDVFATFIYVVSAPALLAIMWLSTGPVFYVVEKFREALSAAKSRVQPVQPVAEKKYFVRDNSGEVVESFCSKHFAIAFVGMIGEKYVVVDEQGDIVYEKNEVADNNVEVSVVAEPVIKATDKKDNKQAKKSESKEKKVDAPVININTKKADKSEKKADGNKAKVEKTHSVGDTSTLLQVFSESADGKMGWHTAEQQDKNDGMKYRIVHFVWKDIDGKVTKKVDHFEALYEQKAKKADKPVEQGEKKADKKEPVANKKNDKKADKSEPVADKKQEQKEALEEQAISREQVINSIFEKINGKESVVVSNIPTFKAFGADRKTTAVYSAHDTEGIMRVILQTESEKGPKTLSSKLNFVSTDILKAILVSLNKNADEKKIEGVETKGMNKRQVAIEISKLLPKAKYDLIFPADLKIKNKVYHIEQVRRIEGVLDDVQFVVPIGGKDNVFNIKSDSGCTAEIALNILKAVQDSIAEERKNKKTGRKNKKTA